MNAIEFSDVHRAYRAGHDVLRGINVSIAPGEVVGLVGKNGAGKTTLIRIALGLIHPQRGRVRIFGLDPAENPVEVKRRIGYVAEDQILPTFMKIREVIGLHRGLFPSWDEAMAAALLGQFSLDPGTRVGTLSKGQARLVSLICAVSHRPDLLLLDEPAGGLDPAARREFLETAIQYLNEAGSTILFSSHYMTDVERLAGRIVMIHDGSILLDSELDQLREEYSLAVVPRTAQVSRSALQQLAGCLAVRERPGAWHAVFRAEPDQVLGLLRRELRLDEARCQAVALEEMFIELAGGQS